MSTGTLSIFLKPDAPFGLYAQLTATGGSWPTGDHAVLLVAWDDPREEDWTCARLINAEPFSFIGKDFGGLNQVLSSTGFTTGAGDNDIVTLNWKAPRRRPHHYTAYLQTGSTTFNTASVALKIRPSSGATQGLEIPGYATSAVFANATSRIETRVAAIHGTSINSYYEIEGNHGLHLFNGASYTVRPVGGLMTTNGNPAGRFVGNEERTRVSESATTGNQTHLEYVHGLGIWQLADQVTELIAITISIATGLEVTYRDKHSTAFDGQNVEIAYINNADIERVTFECTHGGLSSIVTGYYAQTDAAASLRKLHKLRTLAIPVLLIYQEAASTEIYSPVIYSGTIERINELGYSHIQDNQRIQFDLKIDRVYTQSSQHAAYAIVTATVAGSSLVIVGDHTAEFIDGTKLEIIGSTGNDGLYAVSSSQITGSTSTQIFLYNPLLDGADDGHIRIWDQP